MWIAAVYASYWTVRIKSWLRKTEKTPCFTALDLLCAVGLLPYSFCRLCATFLCNCLPRTFWECSCLNFLFVRHDDTFLLVKCDRGNSRIKNDTWTYLYLVFIRSCRYFAWKGNVQSSFVRLLYLTKLGDVCFEFEFDFAIKCGYKWTAVLSRLKC